MSDTLSDKQFGNYSDNSDMMFYKKDVREAVRELIKEIKIDGLTKDRENAVIDDIKKIFGEGLIHSPQDKIELNTSGTNLASRNDLGAGTSVQKPVDNIQNSEDKK